jgi:hypothetical protein
MYSATMANFENPSNFEDIWSPEWLGYFYFYIHQYEDRNEEDMYWPKLVVQVLDSIVCKMFFKVIYRDWCQFLQARYIPATEKFVYTMSLWRSRRTFLISESAAAGKFSKIQKVKFKNI